MLRSTFLWLSERRGLFEFVKRNGLARKVSARFVAGETLDQAMDATRRVNARDITVSLDLLGESVTSREEATGARDAAIEILDRIHTTGVRANLSIKLTQMGLDLGQDVAAANVHQILDRARAHGIFVRVDMEASAYVQRTLDLYQSTLRPDFGDLVGVVIQTMLRRTEADIEALLDVGARVRLVKGAYKEPEAIAFPDKRDVDAVFARCSERMLERGNYPAFATHDEALITHVKEHARAKGIGPERYEFQMLYGVRRDLQDALRQEGYNVRVYVPYGTEWYPYLMRRLAERPANVWFIVGNLLRETADGSGR
ncbi:MAG: proline dehydrogenase family protein [Gemmatimonadota bacterium]|nr:proline dehydrogenase family protein [Gemmatimonadota bacterium]MDH4350966.1 proline dehydrogenase family protein [Gemmatimonadota bacterium]MDH5195753.1 proline dehydrogenase family protein [Gemmatimonadota bacterium]